MIRVLLADDEDIVRAFFRTVIEKEKLPVSEIYEADNGLETIRLAREYTPEAVLLDIRMPGLNGLKVCAEIRREMPNTEVVIISAYDEFDYAREAFTSGARDFLVKPVSPQQVVEVITRIIDDRGARGFPGAPANHPLVDEVRRYIEENLDKEFGLTDLAAAVFVSPSHLSRKFKKLTGVSVSLFIQQMKISRAVELMRDASLSITDISGLVGFNNPGYFATCFKALTGRTPSQYRSDNLEQPGTRH
ncbi:MAG: response regulator [Candidatus Adiutrix sp.]|nr:response regulator [Candidatus Adiutrix sp.]